MKKYILLTAVIAFAISSCKKDKTITPVPVGNPPANSHVKTTVIGNSVTLYEYNPDGTISKISNNGKPWYDYQYKTDSVISIQYLSTGTLSDQVHMGLNTDGQVTYYWNETYPKIVIRYEYDADKKLKFKKNYDNGILSTITQYIFKDGNLVKDSVFTPNGISNYSRVYEFYTDKISTIESHNLGQTFWKGSESKNALKKITYLNGSGVVNSTYDYAVPEVDAQYRISKTSYTATGGGAATTVNYTYY